MLLAFAEDIDLIGNAYSLRSSLEPRLQAHQPFFTFSTAHSSLSQGTMMYYLQTSRKLIRTTEKAYYSRNSWIETD
jgi:hypothetical protein